MMRPVIFTVCLFLASSTISAQTSTFVEGEIIDETLVRSGFRSSPFGTTSISGETIYYDGGRNQTTTSISPFGGERTRNLNTIRGDGIRNRDLVRTTPYGSANGTTTYSSTGNEIVVDGTRETVNGNVVTSDGKIVYGDGSVSRDMTRTGSGGNSVNYTGQTTQTGQGWARNGVRTFPDSRFSTVGSNVIRQNGGFDRSTYRALANGQFVQGNGTTSYGNGARVGSRNATSTSGRGFAATSSRVRSANGYSRTNVRQPNIQRGGRTVSRGRRGR